MLSKYATARFGIIMSIVVALCLVVALVCVFVLRPTGVTPNTTLDQGSGDFIEVEDSFVEPSAEATANPVTSGSTTQGTVYWEQVENNYYEITAVPHESKPVDQDKSSFVFAYWQTSSGTKISGDQTIRVKTYNTGADVMAREYVPVFIQSMTSDGNQSAYVHYVTDLASLNEANLAANGAEGHIFILQNDLVLTSDFTPIGAGSSTNYTAFKGVLDGNGHSIENLRIAGGAQASIGLVCALDGGVIKDLTIRSGEISSSVASGYVGAFAGTIKDGLISRCVNHAAVYSTGSGGTAAGIVGQAQLSTTMNTGNGGSLTSSLYCNENYGAVRGNFVGAIIFDNKTHTTSTSQVIPAAYLIKNINQGSFQTSTATEGN